MPAYDGGRFNPPAPVAIVTLRHSENQNKVADVPMLIDSGADVTLIPAASVKQLGLSINTGKGYELAGFDGSRSIAQAVQLDLLFLRRAFKGQFLTLDQEWGILGRDVLNHLAILLDGPQANWSEKT